MRLDKRFLYIVCSMSGVVLFSFPSILYASEGHLDWNNFTYRVLNLILFIGIIYFMAGKKIKVFFDERKKKIVQDFETLVKEKELLQQSLASIQEKIKNLEEERSTILNKARAEALEEKNLILAQAKEQIDRITKQAQQKMEREREKIQQAIITECAERIYKEVEETLSKDLTIAEQKSILQKSMKKVVYFEEAITSKTLC